MSKKLNTVELNKMMLKSECKKFKKLKALYADSQIKLMDEVNENLRTARRYYKLLRKYEKLNEENQALYKELKDNCSHVGSPEDVLKKEWDTPEEDKAWEGLLDSSSEDTNEC